MGGAPARGAVGSRIIRNAKECYDFHGLGSGREGGGWVQNQKNCMRLLSFSCLWEWVSGGSGPRMGQSAFS